MFCLETIA